MPWDVAFSLFALTVSIGMLCFTLYVLRRPR